jgi:hypothetical protein
VGAAVTAFALLSSLRRANVAASARIASGTQVAARV